MINKFAFLLLVSGAAHAAESSVEVKITSLTNASKSTALEVCGTAVHAEGLKPVLVTLKHDASKYTTLSSPEGDWCVLIKRWTFNGEVNAEGVALKDVMKD